MVKYIVAGLCGYETAAIVSGSKIPTLTALNKQHPVLGPVLIGGLIAHFYGRLVWEQFQREELNGALPLTIRAVH